MDSTLQPNWMYWLKRTDLIFAIGLISVMTILIMPMPRVVMDICLAISLTFSLLIFMTSLLIQSPLEFSTFPTILLVSTMIRLALNVASTRLILSHGHDGLSAAGHVIEAFGQLIMGGSFIIGLIVFAILEIVNFVVITKGSGRIAEVSARFTLDAMPGKQMAIDADLSAGLLSEDQARSRRKELESESNFYGAMDGAAKFVRGDAIAGLLITFINIIGGVIIGCTTMGMTFGNAMTTYATLTVGDGLISQIPALIVSLSAGLLVSKGGVEGTADQALFRQLGAHPAALGMCSALMLFLAFLPGLPFLPFFLLAAICGFGSWKLNKKALAIEHQQKQEETQKTEQKVEENQVTQPMERLRLDMGYGIVHMGNETSGGILPEHIRKLRHQFMQDLGFVIPTIRMQDNLNLQAEEYVITVKGAEAGRGSIKPNHLLVMNPGSSSIPDSVHGEETVDPIFGIPALWVSADQRSKLEGLTVVEPEIILTTHISEIIKDNINELLSYADVQYLLSTLEDPYKKLLADIVPSQITNGTIQRILQNLINERVSIRDLPTILEGIAEGCAASRNISIITEYVRQRLGRQIIHSNLDHQGFLPYVSLSSEWENEVAESLIGEGDQRQISLEPSRIQAFVQQTRQLFDNFGRQGENPVLITNGYIRPYIRSILERGRPSTVIISQNELPAKIKLRSLGSL